jgi:uncharacterized protein
MDRIDTGAFFTAPRDASRQKKSEKAPKAVFRSLVEVEESRSASDHSGNKERRDPKEIYALLDAVHELGEKLLREPGTSHLQAYKEAVRRFLSCVVENGVGVEETQSGAGVNRKKRFTLVKIIDTKLERLAAGMVVVQKDQLLLLEKIEEINGLLVDLLQ